MGWNLLFSLILATSKQVPSLVFSRFFSCTCFLGCAVDGHPTPNITWLYSGEPLSLRHELLAAGRILQILNVSDFTDGEFSCLAQNEAGSLTQVMSLAIQGNFSFSPFTLKRKKMDFPALPFSSWIPPIWNHHRAYQEKDVLMIYCHCYRFSGLLGTLQCLRFYFTKMTPDISAQLSMKHTLLIQAVLRLSLDNFLVQKFKTEVGEFKPLKAEAPLLVHEG